MDQGFGTGFLDTIKSPLEVHVYIFQGTLVRVFVCFPTAMLFS